MLKRAIKLKLTKIKWLPIHVPTHTVDLDLCLANQKFYRMGR